MRITIAFNSNEKERLGFEKDEQRYTEEDMNLIRFRLHVLYTNSRS